MWSTELRWPSGTRIVDNPASAAPWSFSGIPPTGPMVPVALMVPVIVTESSSVCPARSAIRPTVVNAPALGPSIAPVTSKPNLPSNGSPVSSVDTIAAFQAAARDASPSPLTSSSEKSSRKVPSSLGAQVSTSRPTPPVPSER